MRFAVALPALTLFLSLSFGQYVEATILLPDSVSALAGVGSVVFHSPTNTIYLGGSDSFLVAVDARTNSKLRRMTVGAGPHLLCSDPTGNKVYCANHDSTVTVIDAATNQPLKTLPLGRRLTDLIYNEQEDRLYCGNSGDSVVRVIDCTTDSVVASVSVSVGPGALCYHPQLDRVYCVHQQTDEVTVIDCAADTVVSTVWVRGVEPVDICYDSATNSVYTANQGSSTVSVIDCASDTLLRVVSAGRGASVVITGPPGKVYCASSGDSSVSVISGSGVKTVRTRPYPKALSYDSVAHKVYCASQNSSSVAVVDAIADTLTAQVGVTGATAVGWNPAGNSTYVTSPSRDTVFVIGGASDTVEAVVGFFVCAPGPLCYNTTNNHLYCLNQKKDLLFVIDGESNQVLETLNTGSNYYRFDTLIWNQVSNKVYIIGSGSRTVSILDCASDSIVARVATGVYPCALCCSDNGKVYVAVDSGVDVIDSNGDTIRAVVPVPTSHYYHLSTLCYDRTDGKVYVTACHGDTVAVHVIDTRNDSVVAIIPIPNTNGYVEAICWNQKHDKAYACGYRFVAIIDCTGDTVLKRMNVQAGLSPVYNDSVCDKVYCADWEYHTLRIINAATGEYPQSLPTGGLYALLDNGKQGPANRLYCAADDSKVAVVVGYKTDSILKLIPVGNEPSALAWNPTHSWVYVSNSGSSSISVIRDTVGVGVEESQPRASNYEPQVTVVRGMLVLGVGSRQNTAYRAELLDISGRKVLDLMPGANDVRALAPGVYFVRTVGGESSASRCSKIVVTR